MHESFNILPASHNFAQAKRPQQSHCQVFTAPCVNVCELFNHNNVCFREGTEILDHEARRSIQGRKCAIALVDGQDLHRPVHANHDGKLGQKRLLADSKATQNRMRWHIRLLALRPKICSLCVTFLKSKGWSMQNMVNYLPQKTLEWEELKSYNAGNQCRHRYAAFSDQCFFTKFSREAFALLSIAEAQRVPGRGGAGWLKGKRKPGTKLSCGPDLAAALLAAWVLP